MGADGPGSLWAVAMAGLERENVVEGCETWGGGLGRPLIPWSRLHLELGHPGGGHGGSPSFYLRSLFTSWLGAGWLLHEP